jgi:hypothetical protein
MTLLLACVLALAAIVLVARPRGCSTLTAGLGLVLALAACSLAAAAEETAPEPLDFAAIAGKPIAATSPPVEPADFGCVARRLPAAACAVPELSFAAVGRRQPPTKAAAKPAQPKPATSSHLTYRHTDGVWRNYPQPGLTYSLPSLAAQQPRFSAPRGFSAPRAPQCVGGKCFIP